jgi:ACS family D-galactonate transporter-like MFS transporter
MKKLTNVAVHKEIDNGQSINRWALLVVVCFCFFFFSANLYLVVPSIPAMIAELDLTHAESLALMSAFLFTYGLFQIPSALLANKWGAKRIFLSALLIESIFSALVFVAQDYTLIFIFRLISGIGAGLFFSAGVSFLTSLFVGTNRLSLAIGLTTGASYGIGCGLPILIGPMFIASFGWRWLFLVFSLAGICTAVASSFLIKLKPQVNMPIKLGYFSSEIKLALKNKNIWLLGIAFMGVMGAANAYTGFLPDFLINFRGWPESTAGLFTAVGALTAVGVAPIIGMISDKFGNRRRLIMLGGLTSIIFIWLFGQLNLPLIWILPFLATFSTNLVFVNAFAFPHEILGLGLMMTIGVMCSTWIPTFMGILVDQGVGVDGMVASATSTAWLFIAAVCFSAVIFTMLIKEAPKRLMN